MSDAALDDSAATFTLPFPAVDAPRPPRRSGTRRFGAFATHRFDQATPEDDAYEIHVARRPLGAPPSSLGAAARWFSARLSQHGPKLDDHIFKFPAFDRDELAWDWRCASDDVCEFLLLRDEDGPARDPGTAQLLSWFQSSPARESDPAERLWSLKEFLYRFEPGRRWQALAGELHVRSRKLSMAWVGAFEGMIWNERQTLRAIVPTPGSLADDAMPDPMTLRIEWTGRVALGAGVIRGDLSAFRRDDRTPLPFQIHRTTDRR